MAKLTEYDIKDVMDDAIEESGLILVKKDDMINNTIVDKDKFVRQLEQQNLMAEELGEFIENYMRFDNEC